MRKPLGTCEETRLRKFACKRPVHVSVQSALNCGTAIAAGPAPPLLLLRARTRGQRASCSTRIVVPEHKHVATGVATGVPASWATAYLPHTHTCHAWGPLFDMAAGIRSCPWLSTHALDVRDHDSASFSQRHVAPALQDWPTIRVVLELSRASAAPSDQCGAGALGAWVAHRLVPRGLRRPRRRRPRFPAPPRHS